jgi:hypothetical protein
MCMQVSTFRDFGGEQGFFSRVCGYVALKKSKLSEQPDLHEGAQKFIAWYKRMHQIVKQSRSPLGPQEQVNTP